MIRKEELHTYVIKIIMLSSFFRKVARGIAYIALIKVNIILSDPFFFLYIIISQNVIIRQPCSRIDCRIKQTSVEKNRFWNLALICHSKRIIL